MRTSHSRNPSGVSQQRHSRFCTRTFTMVRSLASSSLALASLIAASKEPHRRAEPGVIHAQISAHIGDEIAASWSKWRKRQTSEVEIANQKTGTSYTVDIALGTYVISESNPKCCPLSFVFESRCVCHRCLAERCAQYSPESRGSLTMLLSWTLTFKRHIDHHNR